MQYYVTKSGNDGNDGKSVEDAFLTISHAEDVATSPGDIVTIYAGTYDERVTFAQSGASGNPITFNTNNSDQVIIQGGFEVTGDYNYIYDMEVTVGTNITASDGGQVKISGDYNIIENLYMHECTSTRNTFRVAGSYNEINNLHIYQTDGLYCEGGSSNNTFTDGEIEYTDKQLAIIGGSYNSLIDIDMHDSGQVGTGGNDSDGINIVGSNHLIDGCKLYHIYQHDAGQHVDGIQWWNGLTDTTFKNCIFGSYEDSPLPLGGGDGGADVYHENASARIYWINNVWLGDNNYLIQAKGGAANTAEDWRFINNTVPTDSTFYTSEFFTGWIIANNVFAHTMPEWASGDTFTITNNLYYGGASASSDDVNEIETADTITDIFDDPDLTATGGYGIDADWHPKSGSDAIDAGIEAAYTPDSDAEDTDRGTTPDIGAYEHVATTTAASTNVPINTIEVLIRMRVL